MLPNIYKEIRPELRYIADFLEDSQMEYRVFNNGIQFNAKDRSGIWHSFYPTTGTILLNAGNERSCRQHISLKNRTLGDFMNYLIHPAEVKKMFETRRSNHEYNKR